MKKKLMLKLKNNWKDYMLLIFLIFSSINYFYNDSSALLSQSVDFWEAVFSKNNISAFNSGAYFTEQNNLRSL